MEYGTALAQAMSEANLRDEDLASKVGVTVGTVRRWRTGVTTPSRLAMKALAHHVPGLSQRVASAMKNGVRHVG